MNSSKKNRLCGGLSRVPLCSVLPTPLEEAPRLSQSLGGTRILFKRDDLTGLALGGNKIRNMEYIFGDLLDQGCDSVITTAGVQSNMCRSAAAAACRLGLKSVLLLRGSGNEERQGNLLLDELLGADIRFIHTQDPYDSRVPIWLEEVKQELLSIGHRPYILHLTAITSTIATIAYVDASEELVVQFDKLDLEPDYLFLTVGSGITMSGLVLGLKHLGRPIRVVGISGSAQAEFLSERIVGYANQAAEMLGLSTKVNTNDFTIHDQYIGPGYGLPYTPVITAIQKVAQLEGILLDPVYTGKCMSGLIDQIELGKLSRKHCVVFLHSGGVPSLFHQHKTITSKIMKS